MSFIVTRGLGGSTLVTRGLGGQEEVVPAELGVTTRPRHIRFRGRSKQDSLRQFCSAFVALMSEEGCEGDDFKNSISIEFVENPNDACYSVARLRESYGSRLGMLNEGPLPRNKHVVIDPEEWKFMTFDAKVFGSYKGDVSYRFMIRYDDDVVHGFRGVPTKNGVVVRIPPLASMIPMGSYEASFEIIAGTHVMVPLRFNVDVVKGENRVGAQDRPHVEVERPAAVM